MPCLLMYAFRPLVQGSGRYSLPERLSNLSTTGIFDSVNPRNMNRYLIVMALWCCGAEHVRPKADSFHQSCGHLCDELQDDHRILPGYHWTGYHSRTISRWKHTWFRIGPKIALHVIEGSTARKEYYKNQHLCFTVPSVEAFTAVLRKNNIGWEDRDGP